MTERFWTIAAGVLVLMALVLLWRNSLSAAFVVATLGIVAWFLSYRMQLRAKIAMNGASDDKEETDKD